MMYLKQFPDICREMGLTVKENSKVVTLSVPDICYSIAINKKLFLEDLELAVDSFDDVHEAIAIFEADVDAGKLYDMDADDFQRLNPSLRKPRRLVGSKMTPTCSRQRWGSTLNTLNALKPFSKSYWKN